VSTLVQNKVVKNDNAAVLQLQVTKVKNQFLATLPGPGEAQFVTVLKPCSILLPHVHPAATEFYSILFGARRLVAVNAPYGAPCAFKSNMCSGAVVRLRAVCL
jgi:hypothetical protein